MNRRIAEVRDDRPRSGVKDPRWAMEQSQGKNALQNPKSSGAMRPGLDVID